MASVWMESKLVTVLSTLADPVEHTTVMRKQKDGRSINISCHQAVKIYNQFMGGVDKGDQLNRFTVVRLRSARLMTVAETILKNLPLILYIQNLAYACAKDSSIPPKIQDTWHVGNYDVKQF